MPELLWYRLSALISPEVDKLPGGESFRTFVSTLSTAMSFLDRTGTVTSPITMRSLFPIPKFHVTTSSYGELCDKRAVEIFRRAESQNSRINVLYSGGVDSTLVLVSLLKNSTVEQRSRITVLLNNDSIDENPRFFREYIIGRLSVSSSEDLPHILGSRDILVTGEFNDQLMGSNTLMEIAVSSGNSIISAPYKRSMLFAHIRSKVDDDQKAERYVDILERVAATSPVELGTMADMLWWINFATKWQSVYMRVAAYVAPNNVESITLDYINSHIMHFYSTEEFQLWSMNNRDKTIKDTRESYKWLSKEIITEFTKDKDFQSNKVKRASLQFLLRSEHCYNFIDSSGKCLNAIDPVKFWVMKNDFC